MIYCPLITQTLGIISVRFIRLSLRSKTRRRATLLFPTWISSCEWVGTVNFALYFSTSVTISISILHVHCFPFLRINIPSSPAYGVFISQHIRYAWACSIYECFILMAVFLSNKLLGKGYVKTRIKSSLRSSLVNAGIISNNVRSPSPEYYTNLWRMTLYSDTLHWSEITKFFDPATDLDLIIEFDFLPICSRFPYNICNGCGMPTKDAYSSGHLLLTHFLTCMCSNVETNLSP